MQPLRRTIPLDTIHSPVIRHYFDTSIPHITLPSFPPTLVRLFDRLNAVVAWCGGRTLAIHSFDSTLPASNPPHPIHDHQTTTQTNLDLDTSLPLNHIAPPLRPHVLLSDSLVQQPLFSGPKGPSAPLHPSVCSDDESTHSTVPATHRRSALLRRQH